MAVEEVREVVGAAAAVRGQIAHAQRVVAQAVADQRARPRQQRRLDADLGGRAGLEHPAHPGQRRGHQRAALQRQRRVALLARQRRVGQPVLDARDLRMAAHLQMQDAGPAGLRLVRQMAAQRAGIGVDHQILEGLRRRRSGRAHMLVMQQLRRHQQHLAGLQQPLGMREDEAGRARDLQEQLGGQMEMALAATGPGRWMRRQPQRRTPLGRRTREALDQLAQALRRLGRQVGRHRRGIQVF